jgi:hypothetical protein
MDKNLCEKISKEISKNEKNMFIIKLSLTDFFSSEQFH